MRSHDDDGSAAAAVPLLTGPRIASPRASIAALPLSPPRKPPPSPLAAVASGLAAPPGGCARSASECGVGVVCALALLQVALVSWDLAVHAEDPAVVFWAVAAFFVALTVPLALYDIHLHLAHFVHPMQRLYVRILFLLPIYSIESWCALRYSAQAVYLTALRDLYEAFVVHAFFQLLLEFLGDREQLKARLLARGAFVNVSMWPYGVERLQPYACSPPDSPGGSWLPCLWWPGGGTFLFRTQVGVYQYVVVKIALTLGFFIASLSGTLGEDAPYSYTSFWPYWSWGILLSQVWAITCLVLFYESTHTWLQPLRPLQKFLCVKGMVFLTWAQGELISYMNDIGRIPARTDLTADATAEALQSFLVVMEMLLLGWLHHIYFNASDFDEATGVVRGATYSPVGLGKARALTGSPEALEEATGLESEPAFRASRSSSGGYDGAGMSARQVAMQVLPIDLLTHEARLVFEEGIAEPLRRVSRVINEKVRPGGSFAIFGLCIAIPALLVGLFLGSYLAASPLVAPHLAGAAPTPDAVAAEAAAAAAAAAVAPPPSHAASPTPAGSPTPSSSRTPAPSPAPSHSPAAASPCPPALAPLLAPVHEARGFRRALVSNFSSFECSAGSQIFDVTMQQTQRPEFPPANDVFMRSCMLRDVCIVGGRLTYYVDPVLDALTPSNLRISALTGDPAGFVLPGYLNGKLRRPHNPQLVSGARPPHLAYAPPDRTYMLGELSHAENYGHLLIDTILPAYAAADAYGLDMSEVQLVGLLTCSTMETGGGARNPSSGALNADDCAKNLERWFKPLVSFPLLLPPLADTCFERLIFGHETAFSLAGMFLHRSSAIRAARLRLHASLGVSPVFTSKQVNIVVLEKVPQNAPTEYPELCNDVKSWALRLVPAPSVVCFRPASVSVKEQLEIVGSASLVVAENGSTTYMSLFQPPGSSLLVALPVDDREAKEVQVVLFNVDVQAFYVRRSRLVGGGEGPGTLLAALERSARRLGLQAPRMASG